MGGTIKRRQLLLSGLVIGAGIVTLGTLGPGWLEREDQGLPSLDGHTRREAIEALAGFGDRGLGEAMAHAGVGIDQSADDLLATIWRRATKNGWAPGSPGGRKALGRALQSAVKKDFQSNQVVTFQGFVLAKTEAELARLAALLPTT